MLLHEIYNLTYKITIYKISVPKTCNETKSTELFLSYMLSIHNVKVLCVFNDRQLKEYKRLNN